MSSLIIRPDGQGTYTDWDGDYTDVNEEVLDTGDYVNERETVAKETFTLEDTGLTDEIINSVTVHIWAARAGGFQRNCYFMLRSGTTEVWVYTPELSSSPMHVSHEWVEDPATDDPWTIAAVNALEAGVCLWSTQNDGAFVYQLWVVVEYESVTEDDTVPVVHTHLEIG